MTVTAMDSTTAKKMRASLELVLAGSIWGFGFIVTIWVLPSIGPLWISTLRFGCATILTLTGAAFFPSIRARLSREDIRKAFVPGAFLGAMLFLQTWGLKYTSATNSGFITTLYVVMVPLIEALFFKKRISLKLWALILVALFGTALIAKANLGIWNKGDLLTLACALVAAGHILVIDVFASNTHSPLSLNTFQAMWASLICLPAALLFEAHPVWPLPASAFACIAYLTMISTMIAFLIQIRAQRTLVPALASLLFLLESPFSALFSRIFLNESLLPSQWLGGALILLSAILVIIWPDKEPAKLLTT